jgi:anti-sigma28 factor (negative regulator of flagellin synthesis)
MPRYLDLDYLATLPERAFSPVGKRMTLEGGKGSAAPPAPNYAPMQAASDYAADKAYAAADNDLAFRKQVYEDSKPREQQLYELANQVAQQQIGIADANEGRAAQQWQQHQTTFRPLEEQMALESYGSQYMDDDQVAALQAAIASGDQAAINRLSRQGADAQGAQYQSAMDQADASARTKASGEGALAASRAAADINASYAQQARGLMRMGGDPNRIAAAAGNLANQQALIRSGAANMARDTAYQTERGIARSDAANRFGMTDRGIGLRAGAASFGRNMPNTAAQAYGLATNAGSAAVGNQNQGFMAGLPYAQFAAGGYGNQLGAAGIAQQGALGMGGIMSGDYRAGLNYAGQQAAGSGAMTGSLIGAAGTVAAAFL